MEMSLYDFSQPSLGGGKVGERSQAFIWFDSSKVLDSYDDSISMNWLLGQPNWMIHKSPSFGFGILFINFSFYL